MLEVRCSWVQLQHHGRELDESAFAILGWVIGGWEVYWADN